MKELVISFFEALRDGMTNQIFVSASASWIIANAIKMALYYRQHHRLNFGLLVGTGGMPSAHSALVCGMSTMVAYKEGWGSSVTMLAICFTIVTMTDAAGVRRAAGRQARVLNRLADEIYQGKGIRHERLRELLGHTPTEVFVGGFIGFLVAACLRAMPKLM